MKMALWVPFPKVKTLSLITLAPRPKIPSLYRFASTRRYRSLSKHDDEKYEPTGKSRFFSVFTARAASFTFRIANTNNRFFSQHSHLQASHESKRPYINDQKETDAECVERSLLWLQDERRKTGVTGRTFWPEDHSSTVTFRKVFNRVLIGNGLDPTQWTMHISSFPRKVLTYYIILDFADDFQPRIATKEEYW